jgi:hypothetical protein
MILIADNFKGTVCRIVIFPQTIRGIFLIRYKYYYNINISKVKTRAVVPFFPDARTLHSMYKLQKRVLLRHQSYLIVFMGNTNLRFWQIMPL